ncbi:MAG TPA: substrate-binding domain-containing protein, partial [Blastocatellia bacterium]|nr:substrate-binding domain-containing protein [Blastocatellia bacterium]
MKITKQLFLLALFAFCCLFILSCNRTGTNPNRRLVIAVIPKGVSHFFWQSVKKGADAAGQELNVEIAWKGPAVETDYTGQINIVEDAINKRVDGIVLAPSHGKSLVPVVEKAKREGIPVTIFDSGIETESYISYVSTDNRRGGEVAAERMGEKLGGKGKVAIIGVKKGSVSTDEREDGFRDTITKKFPGIEIVQHLYGEADMAKSLNIATDILTRNSELNGLFASNESSAVGAVRAVKQQGKSGKIVIVGFDSSPPLLDAINDGTLDSLVLQDPFKMGYEGVKTIVMQLKKETPQRRIDTGVKLLTKENMNTP